MALPRIKVAKDKTEIIKKLLDSKETRSAFDTYADILVFAASFGIQNRKKVPLKEIAHKEPAPINLEVFISRGYDRVIKLIAVTDTQDTKILSDLDSDAEAQRIKIFEETVWV